MVEHMEECIAKEVVEQAKQVEEYIAKEAVELA